MSNEAKCQLTLQMPRAEAWDKLRDLSLAHNYVPGLVKTQINTEIKEGVGASRKVFQTETRGIDETVVEWHEGSGFLIRLHRGEKGAPPPFKEAHFRYWLDDGEEEGTTLLTTSLIYTMGLGPLGRVLETLLLKRIFKSVISDVAISLRQFYESGERVTPQMLKKAKAAYRNEKKEKKIAQ